MYGHSLNRAQWGSVLLVFLGLSGEVYDKYQKARGDYFLVCWCGVWSVE